MADYGALLGLGIEEEPDAEMLAKRLRSRGDAADLFSMSTLQPLAQGAQSERQYVQDDAETAGALRKSMAAAAAAKEEADAKMAFDREKFEYEKLNDEATRRSAETVAGLKGKPKGYYTEGKTGKEREAFDYGAGKAAATREMLSTYQDDYSANPLVRGVGLGPLANAIERTVPFGEQDTASANWWSDAAKREMKPRHELFGSAFTEPERKAYEATTFGPKDSPEFITSQLEKRYAMELKGSERQAASYLIRGYDPELVQQNFGDVVDIERLIKEISTVQYMERVKAEQAAARKSAGAGETKTPAAQSGGWSVTRVE